MSWPTPKTIVVPIDFSEAADRVLTAAVGIAGDASSLRAVHVLFPLDAVSPGVAWGQISDETRETAVRESFDALQKRHNLSGVAFDVRTGNPGHEIAEFASDVGADLIVIASHGYHGVKRMVLGSVAERVIRLADCDVLVLRRTDAE